MSRNEAGGLTICNRRRERWPAVVAGLSLVAFWAGVCGLTVIRIPDRFIIVAAAAFGVSVAGMIVFGFLLFVRRPVDGLTLGDRLVPRPGEFGYSPDQIRRVTFGPDPAEDYVESPVPAAVCSVLVALKAYGSYRLLAAVEEARRLRDWAMARRIEVVETAAALGGP
jgi:hypothetical protein